MQKQTKQRSTYNTVSRIRETEKKKREKQFAHKSILYRAVYATAKGTSDF